MPMVDSMTRSICLRVVLVLGAAATLNAAVDLDRDGLDDTLEQALIERFLPRFLVSAGECAGLPAEFTEGSIKPQVRAKNATIYARVSPSSVLGSDVAAVELHYYHLWESDCGPMAHALDVEHVSALIEGPHPQSDAAAWTARYWYAAAHENTVCDTSNAARAAVVGAVAAGPTVWISAGKHASYLDSKLCGERGCGVDHCREMVPLTAAKLHNLGEAGAPLGGAVWIASREWPFEQKLGPDFTPELVTSLDSSEAVVLARVNGEWRPAQFAISAGSDVVGAMGTAKHHGDGGVVEAKERTGGAVGHGMRAVGRAFGRAARAVGLSKGKKDP